jgi:hypothetical protein
MFWVPLTPVSRLGSLTLNSFLLDRHTVHDSQFKDPTRNSDVCGTQPDLFRD